MTSHNPYTVYINILTLHFHPLHWDNFYFLVLEVNIIQVAACKAHSTTVFLPYLVPKLPYFVHTHRQPFVLVLCL